jgi:glycerol-3-phosphate dehydrogenase
MFDVGIIGAGGVVGCAIARELAQRGLSVAAVEKHTALCRETSGLNSRVIHSGFHEIPGTLKSELAREGSALMIQYAEERSIPLLKTGMLIAVPSGSFRNGLWRETHALWTLWKQGRRQNIPFRFVLTSSGVRRIAPIQAIGGIFIPTVCVIDLERLVESLANDATDAGAQFFFGNEVVGITVENSSHVIRTPNGNINARVLINSAGLGAHRISAMAGCSEVDIEFIRGDYYELIGGVKRWDVRTLVYPAVPRQSRSKGIHFGPRTDGRLFLGPSATAAAEPPAPKQIFLEAARKFIPIIQEDDLRWAYAGIRPKQRAESGNSDFVIRLERASPAFINLLGIDSPGLSASMAIAKHVTRIVLLQRMVLATDEK